MQTLITPGELPRWVPGDLLCASDDLGWKDVSMRAYHYPGLDVEVPALADFVVVAYRQGATRMERRFEGRWTRTRCVPGDCSLLTRAQASHWHWTEDIDVSHVYLSEGLVSRVAADMLGRSVAEVRLRDLLQTRDPTITGIVEAIAREAGQRACGSALYVEALGTQLAVHLLRHHASVSLREPSARGRLSPGQMRRLDEHIAEHLHEAITLEGLAGVAGLGTWTFARHFRRSYGRAPHAYVVDQRVVRAQQLLAHGSLALKEVASACGFADQAHLTRVMHDRLGTTPGQLRHSAPD